MISFNGMDIFLERQVSSSALAGGLAELLGTLEQHIFLIESLHHYSETSAKDVVCVVSLVEGQFPFSLSVYCTQRDLPYESVLELIRRFAEVFETRCLTSDDDVNPYTRWLAEPGRPTRKVYLEPVALDEGRYVLDRVR